MLEFSDPIGGDPTNEGAHGSGFDRVNAFQQGIEGGVARCAQWTENPPLIVELPFSSALDAVQSGDLPFGDVVPTTKEDLDLYWSQFTFGGEPYKSVSDVVAYNPKDKGSLPKCSGFKTSDYKDAIFYCQDEDVVAYDRNLVRGVYGAFGDFAVSVLVGNAWASAMQSRLGITGDSKTIGLQSDCLTGAWVGSVPVDQQQTVQARGQVETRQGGVLPLSRRPRRGRAVVPRVRRSRRGEEGGARHRVRAHGGLPARVLPGRAGLPRPHRQLIDRVTRRGRRAGGGTRLPLPSSRRVP